MILKTFDADAFLSETWQKTPRLIRDPWTAWANPLDPDELAGLACEEEVESRLISRRRGVARLDHGPFSPARLGRLDSSPWTLLVQAVDHQVPDVAALIEPFRFVPDWRIDDVMVSLASDGGGVGPHVDQYDVFLIQGLGRRRWRVGAPVDDATEYLPDGDLRLLAGFEATDEWVLGPGDILYVPPGVPHDGVALGGDCMTYSVGFRAPARSELIAHWCDHVLARLEEDDRYSDPDLTVQANPGELSAGALDRLHGMVTEALSDRDAFARWFGEHNSTPKYPEVDWTPDDRIGAEALRDGLARGVPLSRNPASRFSFVRQGGSVLLFVDGETHECEGGSVVLAEQLCTGTRLVPDTAIAGSEPAMALLKTLFDQGSVAFDPGD